MTPPYSRYLSTTDNDIGPTDMSVTLEKKCPAFEKLVLLEYHSNNIKNFLVLFPVRPVGLSNLPGFNRQFLPVEMGDFVQKAPFENLQNE